MTKKREKEMNKWMTQIKQKQGGTELQDIFFYPQFDLSTITVYYI